MMLVIQKHDAKVNASVIHTDMYHKYLVSFLLTKEYLCADRSRDPSCMTYKNKIKSAKNKKAHAPASEAESHLSTKFDKLVFMPQVISSYGEFHQLSLYIK